MTAPIRSIVDGGQPFEPLSPGDWVRDEEGDQWQFANYSSTGWWGYFTAGQHRSDRKIKLPLAGLVPIARPATA